MLPIIQFGLFSIHHGRKNQQIFRWIKLKDTCSQNLFQKKMADPKYANLPGIVSSYLQSINYQAYVKENIYIIFSGYRPARFI